MKAEVDVDYFVVRGSGSPALDGKWFEWPDDALLAPEADGVTLVHNGRYEGRADGALAAVMIRDRRTGRDRRDRPRRRVDR